MSALGAGKEPRPTYRRWRLSNRRARAAMGLGHVALVLGVIALALGASGLAMALTHAGPAGATGATGATGANGTPGATGPQGSKGTNGINATHLWAIVASSGKVVLGSGVNATTTEKLGATTSDYFVYFNQSVVGCAAVATIGGSGTPTPGEIVIASEMVPAYAVELVTYNATGVATAEPFEVVVFC